MNITKLSFAAITIGYSCFSVAGEITSDVITQIAMNNELSPVVFIKVAGAKTGAPTCATNAAWDYVLPLNVDFDKAMYSLLLAAKSSQTQVALAGPTTGVCAFGVEELTYVTSK